MATLQSAVLAVVILTIGSVCQADTGKNMNKGGPYLIANPNLAAKTPFDTDYGTKNAEYFDVYAGPVTTRYGEVFWRSVDAVPLPKSIVERFDGKAMAIVGYEADQVIVQPGKPELSVPINYAYNHHYVSWLKGAHATMVELDGTDHRVAGHPLHMTSVANLDDPRPDSDIPSSQFFSEGNGGEYRKSYHGYPKGMAQLIDSPTEFVMTPMQIDTFPRNASWGSPYKPGPEPKASQAPPNAVYSGHLECPCTDRVNKFWVHTFATQTKGTCAKKINNASMCFAAAPQAGFHHVTRNTTVMNDAVPAGCSVATDDKGTSVVFNTNTTSPVACGTAGPNERLEGNATAFVNFALKLDASVAGGLATMTLTGPADVWFGVGLGAKQMSDDPNAIIVLGNGTVFEQKLGDQQAGSRLPMSLNVTSSVVSGGNRTVVVTRPFKGLTPGHYSFSTAQSQINFINALGSTPTFAYHKHRAAAVLNLRVLDAPTCICDTGAKGYITTDQNPTPAEFVKDCYPEPFADLLQLHNPTCTLETYAGGLRCCHHGNILLDHDQNPWANDTMSYYMKFRFWFQDYAPATKTAPASHKNLVRWFRQTEENAGEYDVVKAPEGTLPGDTVYTITSHYQVKDALRPCNPRTSPQCAGNVTGLTLAYMSCHCHAPACISCELYNADTGDLICRQTPVYGTSPAATKEHPYDEQGYVAIPPCLYGSEDEGLAPPVHLRLDSNITSIKKNNNTYGHYGEMAMWQGRGWVS